MKKKIIQAAGGLIRNEKGEYLLIFRRGKWDLPKGKMDEGETIEKCALREVKEEAGLKNVSIEKKICVTEHEYERKGEMILKKTHWYLMNCKGNQKLSLQTDEEIEDAKWVRLNKKFVEKLDTYANIKEVLWKL